MIPLSRREKFICLFPDALAFRLKQMEEAIFSVVFKGFADVSNMPLAMRQQAAQEIPWFSVMEVRVFESVKKDTYKAVVETVDGKGPAAYFGPRRGGQKAKAELAQKWQIPAVIGETRPGLASGQACGRGAELGPVLAQAVPGLGDRFVQPLSSAEAVIVRPCAFQLCRWIEHAPEQIGREQAPLRSDSLEVCNPPTHAATSITAYFSDPAIAVHLTV